MLEEEDQDGNSAVMKAVKEEKSGIARMLIKCPRVDLTTRDSNGASLQRIARWEKTEVNLIFGKLLLLF